MNQEEDRADRVIYYTFWHSPGKTEKPTKSQSVFVFLTWIRSRCIQIKGNLIAQI